MKESTCRLTMRSGVVRAISSMSMPPEAEAIATICRAWRSRGKAGEYSGWGAEAAGGSALDGHPQEGLGVLLCLRRRLREFDPAGLAPPADQHLRLHDHGIGHVQAVDVLAARDDDAALRRDAVAGEELFGLILV